MEIQKFEYLENKKSFLDEIKKWQPLKKKFLKIADTSFNIDVKLISKVLAKRIEKQLPSLIFSNQLLSWIKDLYAREVD